MEGDYYMAETLTFEEFKSSGLTDKTPMNIVFGAGTIHKGLTFDPSSKKWNFEESLMGATSGGTKLSIKPEFKDIEVDGVLVKTQGLAVKVGETAQIDTNMVELSADTIKMAIVGQYGTSDVEGYDVIESKSRIEKGDYLDNFGYIGRFLDGRPVIVIFETALCTSGLDVDGKNKENGTFPLTVECYAKLSPAADKLPYHIYLPKGTTESDLQNSLDASTEQTDAKTE